MKLSHNHVTLIELWRLGFVATVSQKGKPNLSPKGTFIVLDHKTIAFGEIRSPQTVLNLLSHPEVEVNFVDQFTRKGIRIRAQAQIIKKDTPEYTTLIPKWEHIWGTLANRINMIIKLPIDSVKPLNTPAYDAGTTEEELITQYKQKFNQMYP